MKLIKILFLLLLISCTNTQEDQSDSGLDSGIDVIDDSDIDQTDTIQDVNDADIDSIDNNDGTIGEDPDQFLISSSAKSVGAMFPHVFVVESIPGIPETLYVFNIESKAIDFSYQSDLYFSNRISSSLAENAIYWSNNSVPQDGELTINKIYRMNLETYEILDITNEFEQLKTPACIAGNAYIHLISYNSESGDFLFSCNYYDAVLGAPFNELYRINANTDNLQIIASGSLYMFLSHTGMRPSDINYGLTHSIAEGWVDGTWQSDYTRVDIIWDTTGDTPIAVWDNIGLYEYVGSGFEESSDNYFCSTFVRDEKMDFECQNVYTNELYTPPLTDHHKNLVTFVSSELPELIGWTAGQGLQIYAGNIAQSVELGDIYLLDRTSNVVRQVTFDSEVSYRYLSPSMLPGDQEHRYLLYFGSPSAYGSQLFIKDLREAGILDSSSRLIRLK